LAPNTLGDGTGCDNMTAIIVKFKPTLFKLPVQKDVSNSEAECVAHKRALETDDVTDSEHSEKKQKIEDDLTPSTVDTSS
jgi:protein phosphatase 1G